MVRQHVDQDVELQPLVVGKPAEDTSPSAAQHGEAKKNSDKARASGRSGLHGGWVSSHVRPIWNRTGQKCGAGVLNSWQRNRSAFRAIQQAFWEFEDDMVVRIVPGFKMVLIWTVMFMPFAFYMARHESPDMYFRTWSFVAIALCLYHSDYEMHWSLHTLVLVCLFGWTPEDLHDEAVPKKVRIVDFISFIPHMVWFIVGLHILYASETCLSTSRFTCWHTGNLLVGTTMWWTWHLYYIVNRRRIFRLWSTQGVTMRIMLPDRGMDSWDKAQLAGTKTKSAKLKKGQRKKTTTTGASARGAARAEIPGANLLNPPSTASAAKPGANALKPPI
eukprot:gnl/TRDRNA2_/TRDRNA2_125237_c0_seq1.p1 gnl/TRDRNA2_/TRDRNA2_125237_c0~~gnl/TRDRNA2_/TRDRNA2_125237_c0_seq1.p1  ORF type:complete len:351 (-),score=35.56 gnl/TRDRNA2_/TRDRNA2_125237_c0_seq1:24-1019(-)